MRDLYSLILRSHLLAGLEGIEVPLAGGDIVVAVLQALCKCLGISFARGSAGLGSNLLLDGLLVLVLLGLLGGFVVTAAAAEQAGDTVCHGVANSRADSNACSGRSHLSKQTGLLRLRVSNGRSGRCRLRSHGMLLLLLRRRLVMLLRSRGSGRSRRLLRGRSLARRHGVCLTSLLSGSRAAGLQAFVLDMSLEKLVRSMAITYLTGHVFCFGEKLVEASPHANL